MLDVLISTYWNVNSSSQDEEFCDLCFNLNLLECKSRQCDNTSSSSQVLISTYWNVNPQTVRRVEIPKSSFNLNLLECKSCNVLLTYSCLTVLISTYWNVNVLLETKFEKQKQVLISTYWNVNLFILSNFNYFIQF